MNTMRLKVGGKHGDPVPTGGWSGFYRKAASRLEQRVEDISGPSNHPEQAGHCFTQNRLWTDEPNKI
jgi:hypothetical protein